MAAGAQGTMGSTTGAQGGAPMAPGGIANQLKQSMAQMMPPGGAAPGAPAPGTPMSPPGGWGTAGAGAPPGGTAPMGQAPKPSWLSQGIAAQGGVKPASPMPAERPWAPPDTSSSPLTIASKNANQNQRRPFFNNQYMGGNSGRGWQTGPGGKRRYMGGSR